MFEKIFATLLSIGVVFLLGYKTGIDQVNETKAAHYKSMSQKQIQALNEQREINDELTARYEERLHALGQRATGLYVELERYRAEADRCRFSASFGRLHDKAAVPGVLQAVPPSSTKADDSTSKAKGDQGDPGEGSNGGGYSGPEVAAAIIDNYTTCHETSERLAALQDWVRSNQGDPALSGSD